MSDRQTGAMSSDVRRRTNRRRLLGILGASALTGLAGCSSEEGEENDDSGEDEENGNTETPVRTPTGSTPTEETSNPDRDSPQTTTQTQEDVSGYDGGDDPTCTDLTDSYVTLDPGERRLIFRTEIPEAYQAAGEVRYTNNGSTAEPTTGPIGLGATMVIDQGLQSNTTPFPERDGYELLTETTFNGETRLAAVYTGESTPRLGIAVSGAMLVSGTYGGEEQLFAISIEHQVLRPEDTDTETCRAALREAMAHTFASIEPNPNTTVAEML